MNCLSCGFSNPLGAKFCNKCSGPLAARCASCGTELPPAVKFAIAPIEAERLTRDLAS